MLPFARRCARRASIRKGKIKVAGGTEFGYKVVVADDKRGFVTDYEVTSGNPEDSTLLKASVERHIKRVGRAPKGVAVDRRHGLSRLLFAHGPAVAISRSSGQAASGPPSRSCANVSEQPASRFEFCIVRVLHQW